MPRRLGIVDTTHPLAVSNESIGYFKGLVVT